MKAITWLIAVLLSACSSREVYESHEYAREQYCKDNYPYTDPLYETCMREAQLSYEESLRRLEERNGAGSDK